MLDLIIENGQVYDGTGSPWIYAAIGVEDGLIRALRGDTSEVPAKRRIDASGLTVCPGFIDMHAHSTMAIFSAPEHDPKVRQGVTTELVGVDGNSYAPFRSAPDLRAWGELNAGLDGELPPEASWGSVAEYLSLYDRSVSVNIAFVVGNSALRIAAVGWDDRPPTDREMADMQAMLREAMEEGAFGLSTGLTYPPGSYADQAEVEKLCAEVAKRGGVYVTHIRYGSGDGFLDPNSEAIRTAQASGVALHISHIASTWRYAGQFRPILELVDQAIQQGLQLSFDAYPDVHTGSRALVMLPEWIHEGGPDRLRQRLASKEIRDRLRQEQDPRQARWRRGDAIALTGFKVPHNQSLDGQTMRQIAEAVGKDPLDAICDLLLEEDLRISEVGINGNDAVNVRHFLRHPHCMVGSDGILVGEHPSPRTYGTFPKVLGGLVREERLLELADAIRKITSWPAQLLGLTDRGLLRDGMAADIVVFDAGSVSSLATLEEPKQQPVGIPYVCVNGELVIDDGRHTGALPGRPLRSGNI